MVDDDGSALDGLAMDANALERLAAALGCHEILIGEGGGVILAISVVISMKSQNDPAGCKISASSSLLLTSSTNKLRLQIAQYLRPPLNVRQC